VLNILFINLFNFNLTFINVELTQITQVNFIFWVEQFSTLKVVSGSKLYLVGIFKGVKINSF